MTRLVVKIEIDDFGTSRRRVVLHRECAYRAHIGRPVGEQTRVRNRREMHRARRVAIAGGEECEKKKKKKLARTQRDIKGQKRTWGAREEERAELLAQPHRRRSRAHNLPIGTLHYSCLQLQPANQPGPSPARILSPAPIHCRIPAHP